MEILVSTALSLILLGAVVRMFGDVGQGITNSRAMLEAADRLRLTAARLQQDLAGITVPVNSPPPHKPENNEGYFEYIEGPVYATTASTYAVNTDNGGVGDTTVGDFDDILMFTTRSTGQPFVGRFGATTIQSDVAEVAWFVRGRTLYRRVLLVAPSVTLSGVLAAGFYANYDVSVRASGTGVVANTLGDLTKRENRFAHQTGSFPYSLYVTTASWSNGSNWSVLRLPTLCECSYYKDVGHYWGAGGTLPDNSTITLTRLTGFSAGQFDAWRNPLPYSQLDPATGAHNAYYTPGAPTAGQRIADDVILTNVIGFDVKAWDPQAPVFSVSPGNTLLRPGDSGYPAAWSATNWQTVGQIFGAYTLASFGSYADLGYGNTDYATAYAANPALATGLGHFGHPRSGLNGTATSARIYDTYSFHYENDGVREPTAPTSTNPVIDAATNGFDDNGDGVVDDIVYNGAPTAGENETGPPYPIPLRGIQVKIRIFEPDSRQIREVTVVQDFLSQ